ncbi:redoxin domain-containing protein [Ruminococcaceae bacterium OttesenSCG-928-I18]|nr:redoxin domain-containing protein [Ruminococcaceae bacterium OttesenSCG-928-I18]
MNLNVSAGVPAVAVFLQGLLSFFSPCVLPLVPLYLGYLAGGAKTVDEQGVVHYKRSRVMLNTLFFVLGISFAFFLLGLGFTTLGRFFSGNQVLFARISGILIIMFGLLQLGFFDFKWTGKVVRLPFKLDRLTMNPMVALVLGFTFSFAWTPCVGPMLTSVLLMASSAKTAGLGFVLIALYTLGFVLPFLAVGLFTGALLDFFKKYQKAVKYTAKIGGVLMILIGIMTFTGWMNNITGYLSQFIPGAESTSVSSSAVESGSNSDQVVSIAEDKPQESSSASSANEEQAVLAPDFTLVDQYGVEHTLSEYKGKVIFLNFWATWCPPCRGEMPDIQALYEDHGNNEGDVVILGVVGPGMGQEGSVEHITSFLEDGGYTYPTVMDLDGSIFAQYGISAFPTTFMISPNGEVFGYVPGAMTRAIMDDIIQQTLDAAES